jgi:hypothetical protein
VRGNIENNFNRIETSEKLDSLYFEGVHRGMRAMLVSLEIRMNCLPICYKMSILEK